MQSEGKLSEMVGFRAPEKMVDDIEAYRRMRRLPKKADAARELMTFATAEFPLLNAATEARALGLDPVAVLRERIAQVPAAIALP